jgi:ribosomal protein S18 acetylase RimI-like enzyme
VAALGERTAHIAQMAVAPGHRGCGVGRRLVQLAAERAGHGGFDRLTLLVAQSNPGARRLYERAGFEAAAEFVFADREVRAATT